MIRTVITRSSKNMFILVLNVLDTDFGGSTKRSMDAFCCI